MKAHFTLYVNVSCLIRKALNYIINRLVTANLKIRKKIFQTTRGHFHEALREGSWEAISSWHSASVVSHDKLRHPRPQVGALKGEQWRARLGLHRRRARDEERGAVIISPGLLVRKLGLCSMHHGSCQRTSVMDTLYGDPAMWVKSSCLRLVLPAGYLIYWKLSDGL